MSNQGEILQHRRRLVKSPQEGKQSALLLITGLLIAIALPWLLRGTNGTALSERSSPTTPPTTSESTAIDGAHRRP